MSQGTGKDRTIFILFIPGGAMLGIIPAVVLARLEELTETPTSMLFQVVDGVSTGSILASGINAPGRDAAGNVQGPDHPKYTAQDTVDLFCDLGPRYFPDMPWRYHKMLAANILNTAEDFLDPLHADAHLIREMERAFLDIRQKITPEQQPRADAIQAIVTEQWLSASSKKTAMKMIDELGKDIPAISELLTHVNEVLFLRPTHGLLSRVFCQTAIGGMNMLRHLWANNYLYDPEVPTRHFQDLFGDARMSDCLRSTYISAYDLQNNRVNTFFCRKADFFSTDPDAPCDTSPNNPHLWDAVMASIANPFAFPPHATEDGVLCSDKAFIHTPIHCVQDVLAHKPADAKVKLVVLGTGQYLSKKYDKDNEALRDEYVRYGVLGNLIRGQEILELESYAMSEARASLSQSLGNENIIELSPRLAPQTFKETDSLPSKDILDASDDNIQKILKKAHDFVQREDQRLRGLARMMVENLHNLGQMDDEKFQRVMKNLGYTGKPAPPQPAPEEETTLGRILSACPGLRSAFSTLSNWMNPGEPAAEQNNSSAPPPANDDRPPQAPDQSSPGPVMPGPGVP